VQKIRCVVERITSAPISPEPRRSIYDDFEDSVIVSMNYISGNSVDENLVGNMRGDNDLKIVFQRLDKDPFSIELWFTHTRQIPMQVCDLLSDVSPSHAESI